MSSRVAIVGGGLGGLAAACTLAARGHRVRLFEANGWLGGKAAVLQRDGFTFDMGPTVLTVPDVLERIFLEAGRRMSDYLTLHRLDPQWRCFFEDGTVLDLHAGAERMRDTLRLRCGEAAARGFGDFVALSRELHRISEAFFFWKPVGGLRDTLDLAASFKAGTIRDLARLRMGRTVAATIRSKVPHARVAQMLDHFTQYVGSSPYGSPAVLCAIASMQLGGGVWYPAGGTRAVPRALARLAAELGVEVETGVEIAEILERDGAARGVRTADGRIEEADAVVSNMDSLRTYRELLKSPAAKREMPRGREPSCSGVVLYLGLDRRYEHLLHHNFVFSEDPKAEFEHIYARGEPAPDPTCYVAAPSVTDASVAPAGGEALYVLVHTPYLRAGHDWTRTWPAYRERVLAKLARCGRMADIERHIVSESVLTPPDLLARYRVPDGAIYGLASHGRFLGAFKPGNRSRRVRGLYLAGGSAHPGPGMPMTLMSGWIAADALCADAARLARARTQQASA